MNISLLSRILDQRSRCLSILCETSIGEYIELIDKVYASRGHIEGQRGALKTKSAITIRNRMVDDIKKGAVLPAIVVGVLLNGQEFNKLVENDTSNDILNNLLSGLPDNSLSLIDGMQRTTALKDALDSSSEIADMPMRLEFWVSANVNNLLYRMLVLNSGQIPWDVRRQLEVLYKPIVQAVKNSIEEIDVYKIEDKQRRFSPGEYQADDLIEMFIAFGSRKEKVDSKEHIAQEFTRLDFVEATNKADLVAYFTRALRMFYTIDKVFSKSKSDGQEQPRTFKDGASLMKSQPLRIGFMTALAVNIFGKPGRDKDVETQERSFDEIEHGFYELFSRLDSLDDSELATFIDIDSLNESLPKTSSRIGEHDRKYFKDAFGEMFSSIDDLPSMTQCWRAY